MHTLVHLRARTEREGLPYQTPINSFISTSMCGAAVRGSVNANAEKIFLRRFNFILHQFTLCAPADQRPFSLHFVKSV